MYSFYFKESREPVSGAQRMTHDEAVVFFGEEELREIRSTLHPIYFCVVSSF